MEILFMGITLVVIVGIILIYSYEQGQNIKKHISESSESINAQISHLNGRLNIILDSLESPAWYKIKVDDEDGIKFIMCYVNPAYETFFNVKKSEYIGKTDFNIWPQEIAEKFYDNDLMTYDSKTSIEFMESVTNINTGKTKDMLFKKSYFSDGLDEGVFGIMIDNKFDIDTE